MAWCRASRPFPRTGSQGDAGRHDDFRGFAVIGVGERDFHVVAQVGAALVTASAALRRAAAHEIAEEVLEDVFHRGGEFGPKPPCPPPPPSKAACPNCS